MTGGMAGAARTVSVLATLDPHELFAVTESTHDEKLAGQSTVTALRLEGPLKEPQVVFQL